MLRLGSVILPPAHRDRRREEAAAVLMDVSGRRRFRYTVDTVVKVPVLAFEHRRRQRSVSRVRAAPFPTTWFDQEVTAYTEMLRQHVHPSLRAAGYARAASTWRRQSPRGDLAVVNLQRSRWEAGDRVTFYVNLAVLPAARWRYIREEWDRVPAAPQESHGLLRRRLDPADGAGWQLHDAASAEVCGRALGHRLDHVAVPELAALLDRDHLLGFIAGGAPGWWVTEPVDLARAYVIGDQGPGAALAALLDSFDRTAPVPRDQAKADWLRRNA
ncbi:DUF4304 domain-containing protein [Virgisporangium ochraceum]|uniref:DUF4304 domain-containing protein n=1 Tax=Virgisporangium ochraceum TaxID=65505 RepID=A0A8J4ECV2_9ACTN|nr:DUF4304 domain-containing protein [Virgisporangium ochraceum]GIJ70870.1 hypothetical protein Voc01_057870 [Virgisporangium ochraceum]